MAVRLEEAELHNAQPGAAGAGFDNEGSAALFAAAFKEDMGLDLQTTDPEQAAEHLNSRAIRNVLLAGLDDWLFFANANDEQAIAKILRTADPAANSFRNRLKSAVLAKDRAALTHMATGEEAHHLSPVDVTAPGPVLGKVGAETEALNLLREGQSRYSNDLWINFDLAQHLERRDRRPTMRRSASTQLPRPYTRRARAFMRC